ncbi:hypothetical protein CDAR_505361 [Caerostris darwini]|uniref:Uncharacterized protein n=1 Tax=Caerostris darwini TaxID=1538125 RepID=A0AAV4UQF8_9ARAC|nr:hypothetical protein CDAR_505361 [Caerostris darwini]
MPVIFGEGIWRGFLPSTRTKERPSPPSDSRIHSRPLWGCFNGFLASLPPLLLTTYFLIPSHSLQTFSSLPPFFSQTTFSLHLFVFKLCLLFPPLLLTTYFLLPSPSLQTFSSRPPSSNNLLSPSIAAFFQTFPSHHTPSSHNLLSLSILSLQTFPSLPIAFFSQPTFSFHPSLQTFASLPTLFISQPTF